MLCLFSSATGFGQKLNNRLNVNVNVKLSVCVTSAARTAGAQVLDLVQARQLGTLLRRTPHLPFLEKLPRISLETTCDVIDDAVCLGLLNDDY